MKKLTADQITTAKGKGFLLNRGTDCFSGRTFSGNGVYTSAQLRALADCADKYGNGTAALTTRLAVELPGIAYDDIENAERFVNAAGMVIGGTGAKVRPVTACKGTTCIYGNCDTQALARALHERFYIGWRSVVLPHKFKIGVGGCPNSCIKPSLNDLGIEARCDLKTDISMCRSCKTVSLLSAAPCTRWSVLTANRR
jgi:dissimilatory sulfite reductase (desulfoviridin) alpha/beta subunit